METLLEAPFRFLWTFYVQISLPLAVVTWLTLLVVGALDLDTGILRFYIDLMLKIFEVRTSGTPLSATLSDARLLRPSADRLFTCDPTSHLPASQSASRCSVAPAQSHLPSRSRSRHRRTRSTCQQGDFARRSSKG